MAGPKVLKSTSKVPQWKPSTKDCIVDFVENRIGLDVVYLVSQVVLVVAAYVVFSFIDGVLHD